MKQAIKITSLLLYLLFTQVYPYVLWHSHDYGDDVEIHMSIHPPEDQTNNHDHDQDHFNDHTGDHEHNETHIVGDWEYTISLSKINFRTVSLSYRAPPHLV